jgi:hypothetical protein
VPRSIALGFEFMVGANEIEVRDNEQWSPVTGWSSAPGVCGVKVRGGATTSIAIGEIEAAITASSHLITITAPHASPSAVVDVENSAAVSPVTGAFPAASPTGEALKLTGLGLEVGNEGHLTRRAG